MKPSSSCTVFISLTSLLLFPFFAGFTLFTSCSSDQVHIYTDPAYKQKVESKFDERKALALNRDTALFSVFNQDLSLPEQEGLKFLYAYMPLNDLADYDGHFFLNQVKWSLQARDTFSWGKNIPEELFRHFVLPYRVNNENVDTARIVIFNELKDRIRNSSMLEAALEVNHWCHEKVTYRGSDERTSAPLASMKTAHGRCGEESTFTVAALRSVAIPARQVYTPRWAHSDDNHAWVEFWADGIWHYLGACEPECIPDYGWFTEPARRAMLIHTKAFGDYQGKERVENREPNFALLNTLTTYAPTKEIFVRVLNQGGNPMPDVSVEFNLYNYAEYYPISVKKTDENGFCSLLTGFGDLLIWAYQDANFGFEKITVADVDTLTISIDQKPFVASSIDLDMVPPILRDPLLIANDCRDRNNLLLRREDSIRSAYEATFRSEEQARSLAGSLGLDPDETWNFISRSRGNYTEIENFLNSAEPLMRPTAMKLLTLISDKDLRDTKAGILADHMINAPVITGKTSGAGNTDQAGSQLYVSTLNPRVANEMLVAYRDFLTYKFGQAFIDEMRQSPKNFIGWVRREIKINSTENYYKTPLTPVGVYNLRIADEESRNIFTVACYRTFGIPSRLKTGTLEVEYWLNDHWFTADFGDSATTAKSRATLILTSDPANPVKPLYETHYTLARFNQGKYKTMAYGYGSFTDLLAVPLDMDEGFYLLVTGNRLPGGKVLSNLNFFELKGGERKTLMITLRQSGQAPVVIGSLSPDWPVKLMDNKPFDWNSIVASGRAVICWIEPDKETSKHVFQDLGILKKELDALNSPFIFLIPENKLPAGFTPDSWKNLPGLTRFATIPDLTSLTELEKATGKSLAGQYPVVIRINEKGDVTYLSSGYKIGIGEEIIKEVQKN